MTQRRPIIGVIGAGAATPRGLRLAEEVGRLLAEQRVVVVCGGLGGVMEAACRGAFAAGGTTIGILPGADASQANPFVSLPIVTNLGHARNVLVAQTAQVLIAVEGEYGTLSEVAIGLKIGRPVIALESWPGLKGVVYVESAVEAVTRALELI
jgi:uncharacterized protein (TIGR00725 family)